MKILSFRNQDLSIKTYKVPGRIFNLLFNVTDLQGDLFIGVAVVFFRHAVKLELVLWDHNKNVRDIDWRIFCRK